MPRRQYYGYSYKNKQETKKNIRRAYLFGFLTIAFLTALFFFGLPLLANFAAFLTNLKKSSIPVEVQDTTPPPPPRFDSLPDFTNSLKIEVKGTSEPGSIITLHLNSKEEEVVTNSEGSFTYSFALNNGVNRISATAKDSSGNESQQTQTVEITYDNNPPSINLDRPSDGQTFYGNSQKSVTFSGSTEEGSTLYINDRFVYVKDDGTFTYDYSLSDGENDITVKSTDRAGNETSTHLILHYNP